MSHVSSDFEWALKVAKPIQEPKIGNVVSGVIVSATPKMILVDLNGQFTGIVTGSHLSSSTEDVTGLKKGDLIESIVIGDDKNSGLVILSLRKASQIRLIEKLNANFGTKEIITVIPNEANKGGLLIDLDGIKGFIPVSQLTPVNYPRVEGANPERILDHLQKLVGKPFKVRVINVGEDGKKIIFSEKAAMEEQRSAALHDLKVGDNVDGVVSGILSYGLFVTFNGIEGLVHVSEIDWGHVNDPSKFAKVGDRVRVQVIGIEAEKISLSMKRLRPNPWQVLSEKTKVGDVVEAPVMRIADFGVFIALDGGISGLIHLSEISHSMVKNIDDFVKVGQVIKAKVITFDPIAKRIGLSMKALEEAPKKEEKAEEKTEEKTEKKAEKKSEKKTEKKAEAPVADVPASEEASVKKERKPRKKATSETSSEETPKAE